MSASLQKAIRSALATVKDPELGLDLVSLGLVYGIRIDDGTALVQMSLTTPACPLAPTIVEHVRSAVSGVEGVQDVKVDLTFDPPWTPARMSEEARSILGLPPSKQ